MTSPKQKPLIGWMIFEEYDDDFSNWDGHIAYPNPTGANLAWLNPIKMIEHSAYAALEKENAELKQTLEYRNETIPALRKTIGDLRNENEQLKSDNAKERATVDHFIEENKNIDEENQELRANLEVAVEALKRECCCPGEKDYNGKDILCDPCEARAKLKDGGE